MPNAIVFEDFRKKCTLRGVPARTQTKTDLQGKAPKNLYSSLCAIQGFIGILIRMSGVGTVKEVYSI